MSKLGRHPLSCDWFECEYCGEDYHETEGHSCKKQPRKSLDKFFNRLDLEPFDAVKERLNRMFKKALED